MNSTEQDSLDQQAPPRRVIDAPTPRMIEAAARVIAVHEEATQRGWQKYAATAKAAIRAALRAERAG